MEDSKEPGHHIEPASNGATWPDVVRELAGKIPEAYQKSLLKAGIRLIHSATTVGTTWLETTARDLESKQRARETIRDALVNAASVGIRGRPDVVQRAVDHFVNDVIAKQENREEVLKKSIEFLTEGPTPTASAEPPRQIEEDWLEGLSRHAENASSERLRTLFGKILAGEIRSPGTYSLFTLDHLTKLRRQDTELIVKAAPLVLSDIIVSTPKTRRELPYHLMVKLVEIGVINPVSVGGLPSERGWPTSKDYAVGHKPAMLEVVDDTVFVFTTDEPKTLKVPCTLLTATGVEILTLFDYQTDIEMLQEVADIPHEQNGQLMVASIVGREGNVIRWANTRHVSPKKSDAQ